jgi:hypothetical protein
MIIFARIPHLKLNIRKVKRMQPALSPLGLGIQPFIPCLKDDVNL